MINKILEKFGMVLCWLEDGPRDAIKFIEAKEKNKELIGAEIGVYKAKHAKGILKLLNMKKLYLIDHYDDYNEYADYPKETLNKAFNEAKKRMKKFKDKHQFIRKNSSDVIGDVPNNLDFVYIDGNHSYEYVKQDIENYWKKIKINGVLSGHDIVIEDVLKAVLEFVTKNNLKLQVGERDWWIVKLEDDI